VATQTVLNVTYQPIQINAAGQVLASRQPYLYDDATITAPDFSIIQRHIAAGRLQIITSGVSLPAPTDGAVLTSVKIQGSNLVFTDSTGTTTNVPLPTGGTGGGSVDLSAYAKTADITTAIAAKADASDVYPKATIDNAIGAKADATAVYSRAQVDSMLAAIGSSVGGNQVVLIEKPNGYCLPGSTTPVTAPASDKGYVFNGYADPPFFRDQDLQIKIDRGIVPIPVTLSLTSTDDFDTGKNANPAAAVALDTTHWGGEVTFFRQSSDGSLAPTGWGSVNKQYFIVDKTQTPSARMRAELRLTNYSSNTTQRSLKVWVNVTATAAAYEQATGYTVVLDTTSAGSTENWTVARVEAGAVVATIGTFSQARASAPRSVTVESNGKGAIIVTVDNVILNQGKPFVDPSTTALTGRYAGISGSNTGSSANASMNAKADMWRVYA
jgi:hypothetical protein